MVGDNIVYDPQIQMKNKRELLKSMMNRTLYSRGSTSIMTRSPNDTLKRPQTSGLSPKGVTVRDGTGIVRLIMIILGTVFTYCKSDRIKKGSDIYWKHKVLT